MGYLWTGLQAGPWSSFCGHTATDGSSDKPHFKLLLIGFSVQVFVRTRIFNISIYHGYFLEHFVIGRAERSDRCFARGLTWRASWSSGSSCSIWGNSRAWDPQRCSEPSTGWQTMLQRGRERQSAYPFPCPRPFHVAYFECNTHTHTHNNQLVTRLSVVSSPSQTKQMWSKFIGTFHKRRDSNCEQLTRPFTQLLQKLVILCKWKGQWSPQTLFYVDIGIQ